MIKQISIFAENQKGAMLKMTGVLVDANINMYSLITNDSGNVVQRIEYLPYGEVFLGQKNIPVISKINGTIF